MITTHLGCFWQGGSFLQYTPGAHRCLVLGGSVAVVCGRMAEDFDAAAKAKIVKQVRRRVIRVMVRGGGLRCSGAVYALDELLTP